MGVILMNSNININSSYDLLNNSNSIDTDRDLRKFKIKENYGILNNTKENSNAYETRIMTLNERLDITSNADDQKFKLVKDKLSKLQEGIANEKIKLEHIDDAQFKTIELLENNCLTQFSLNSQEKKEKESQLDTFINDKFFE